MWISQFNTVKTSAIVDPVFIIQRLCLHKESMPFMRPTAKNRSPTSILEALAGTVHRDPTMPHYSFIDDTLTLPTDSYKTKSYFMAKEMGRRAARKLVEEWPTLFMFDRDQPRLAAFRPQKPLDPSIIEPCESNLLKMIFDSRAEDALKLYKRLLEQDIDVTQDSKNELFKLACFYNGQNDQNSEFEHWHGTRNSLNAKNDSKGQERSEENAWNFWDNQNMAESIFEHLPKTEANYSTLICGLCKFKTTSSSEKASKLFQEMLENGLRPHEEAFNFMISNQIPLPTTLDSSTSEKVPSIDLQPNWLRIMTSLNIKPSVRTFNLMLKNIKDHNLRAIEQIISDIAHHGVKPNLTTYHIILSKLLPEKQIARQSAQNAQKQRMRIVTILHEILNQLERRKSIEIEEVTDRHFFLIAMNIACHSNNTSLVDHVERIYSLKTNNVHLISMVEEPSFYRAYLMFKLQYLTIHEAFKLYESLVPSLIPVTHSLLSHVFVVMSGHNIVNWSFLNRLIQDVISSSCVNSMRFAYYIHQFLMKVDHKDLSATEKIQHKKIVLKFIEVFSHMVEITHPTNQQQQQMKHIPQTELYKWTPMRIIHSVELLLQIGEREKAWSLLNLLFDAKTYEREEVPIYKGIFPREQLLKLLENEKEWQNHFLPKLPSILTLYPQHVRRYTVRTGIR